MILRERVGGDGRVKGLASGTGLSFFVPMNVDRPRGRPFAESGGHVVLVLTALGERGPCSVADCKAGGGRARLDSGDDDDGHDFSCAAISVDAAGVGGRIGVGMSSEVLLLIEKNR